MSRTTCDSHCQELIDELLRKQQAERESEWTSSIYDSTIAGYGAQQYLSFTSLTSQLQCVQITDTDWTS